MINTENNTIPATINSLFKRLNQAYQPMEDRLEELKKAESFSTNQIIHSFKIPKNNVERPITVGNLIAFLGEFDSVIAEIAEKDQSDERLKEQVSRRIIRIQQQLLSKYEDQSTLLSNEEIKKVLCTNLKIEAMLSILLTNFEAGYCVSYSGRYLPALNRLLTQLSIYTKEMEVDDPINFDYTVPRNQQEYEKPEFDTKNSQLKDCIAQINRYAYFINEYPLIDADVYAYRII